MIKIMLICNGKFTKKNPFNRAFLHGRKGLCMSYKEFIENLQKEIESRIGEATILFHKVTKNNGVTKDCFLIRENGYDVSLLFILKITIMRSEMVRRFRSLRRKFSISIRSAETIHRWMQDIFWNLII